jgi:hypothetical protein
MTRAVPFTLAAGVLLLVCACRSDRLNQPIGRPLASFSDGAHSGNPDFFFLSPLFKNPTTDPNFSPDEFNAGVRPTVEICVLGPLVPPETMRSCVATIKTFGAGDVRLDVTNEQYQVDWQTTESNLIVTNEYRIRVFLGTLELGYADVDPVPTGDALKNVDTGEFIGLVDGRTLPIKFRIENGVACNGGDCDSKTMDLSQGGFVVLATTGDRVDIPAQNSSQIVTITLDLCDGIDIDLPVFGNCLRVTSDPPLAATLAPPATVSMCSIHTFVLPPLHAQQDLLTLHRQDGAVVNALAHADDFCGPRLGQTDDATASRGLAAKGWTALRRAVAWIFKPGALHASTAVLDVGQGGQTDGFSDFQFALPAKMVITSLLDQVTGPNGVVSSAPSVFVSDAGGVNGVANARVHFHITSTTGGSITPLDGVVVTDENGNASLAQWQLGATGAFTVEAYGVGIADPEHNGPAEGFDPFAPAVLYDPAQDRAQAEVLLGTGTLTFRASVAVPDLVISTGAPTVTPATVVAGGTVQLSGWTIFNQGNGDATTGVDNGFYFSTDPVITPSDVRLDFNSNTAAVLTAGHGFDWGGPTLTIPSTVPGTYYIGILVDERNALAELDETNNYVSTPLVVVLPPPPGGLTLP